MGTNNLAALYMERGEVKTLAQLIIWRVRMEDELDMLFRWHEIDDPKLLETVKTIRQSARDNALAYAAKHGYVAPPEPKSPIEE